MANIHQNSNDFDAIIVGGGHNGLVAAGYLAKAGHSVAVLESRSVLGGPVGTYEFIPGYKASFSNSPGSLDPKIVADLKLKKHGLRFLRPDPTLVHHFPSGAFIGWRDRQAVARQLEALAPGEAERYRGLLEELEALARKLGISVYEPAPDLDQARQNLDGEECDLFDAVFYGSLRDLLETRLQSKEAQALLAMVALNTTLAHPSEPGTAVGMMMRPLSMASTPPADENDLRQSALRGSTGLPVGGMGAFIDALEDFCLSKSVRIERNAPVAEIRRSGHRLTAVTATGDEYTASRLVSAINPQTTFSLIDDAAIPEQMRTEINDLPMTGSACKMVFALDGIPSYAGLPDGLSNRDAASTQLRICPSIDYIERQIEAVRQHRMVDAPLVWGLIPTLTSPGMAPEGRHMLSANVWHAPYQLAEGDWATRKDEFARNTLSALSDLMPDIQDRIIDMSIMTPPEIEAELGLVRSHITHGDMTGPHLFGPRPHARANDYRTPLPGLYLSGSGTWPGGYVTGLPGMNASRTVLEDIHSTAKEEQQWNFS